MKYILSLVFVLCFIFVNSQDDKWQARSFSYGLFYSYEDYSGLNRIMEDNGYPQFEWAPIGLTTFVGIYKNNLEFLYSSGIKGRGISADSFKLHTAEYHLDWSVGYNVLRSEKLSITPFIGLRGKLNGYWLTDKNTSSTLSGSLKTDNNNYSFLSFRSSIIIGAQVGVLKNKGNRDLISFRFDILIWDPSEEFFRPGHNIDESNLIRQGIFLNIGVDLGE